MVDPVYEVNPLMAAADLASNIVFTPLAVFGKNNQNRRPLPVILKTFLSLDRFVFKRIVSRYEYFLKVLKIERVLYE
jgi:hypothetical protein